MDRWRAMVASLAAAVLLGVVPSAVATAPGQNGKIVFSALADDTLGLYTVDADGTGVSQLPVGSGRYPAWSANGQKIAFRCLEPVADAICEANADGNGKRFVGRVEAVDEHNGSPTWSPDGQHIMWTFTDTEFFPQESELWRMDASNGGDLLYFGRGRRPDWSPDGLWIAFATDDVDSQQIRVMRRENTGAGPDLTSAGSNNDPSWSPNGQIAFSSTRDGNREIYVMNADGTGQTRLTENAANDVEPDFSPDGRKIVFTSNRDGGTALYTMNVDGSGVAKILDAMPFVADPDWQPLPDGYVRPKAAPQMKVPLVPAFSPCEVPNRVHGPPLATEACNPPQAAGLYASVGPKSEGRVRLWLVQSAPPYGYHVNVSVSLTDVIRNSDGADALGSLDLTLELRVTDKASGDLQNFPATVQEPASYHVNPLHIDVPCGATSDPSIGSTCSVQTVVPFLGRDDKRTVVEADRITLYDGGEDGHVDTRDDNSPLAVQGLFVP